MKRILFLLLAMLVFFLIFANSYSALDGGNRSGAAIGFWGFMLSPVVFCCVVLTDAFRK